VAAVALQERRNGRMSWGLRGKTRGRLQLGLHGEFGGNERMRKHRSARIAGWLERMAHGTCDEQAPGSEAQQPACARWRFVLRRGGATKDGRHHRFLPDSVLCCTSRTRSAWDAALRWISAWSCDSVPRREEMRRR